MMLSEKKNSMMELVENGMKTIINGFIDSEGNVHSVRVTEDDKVLSLEAELRAYLECLNIDYRAQMIGWPFVSSSYFGIMCFSYIIDGELGTLTAALVE